MRLSNLPTFRSLVLTLFFGGYLLGSTQVQSLPAESREAAADHDRPTRLLPTFRDVFTQVRMEDDWVVRNVRFATFLISEPILLPGVIDKLEVADSAEPTAEWRTLELRAGDESTAGERIAVIARRAGDNLVGWMIASGPEAVPAGSFVVLSLWPVEQLKLVHGEAQVELVEGRAQVVRRARGVPGYNLQVGDRTLFGDEFRQTPDARPLVLVLPPFAGATMRPVVRVINLPQ